MLEGLRRLPPMRDPRALGIAAIAGGCDGFRTKLFAGGPGCYIFMNALVVATALRHGLPPQRYLWEAFLAYHFERLLTGKSPPRLCLEVAEAARQLAREGSDVDDEAILVSVEAQYFYLAPMVFETPAKTAQEVQRLFGRVMRLGACESKIASAVWSVVLNLDAYAPTAQVARAWLERSRDECVRKREGDLVNYTALFLQTNAGLRTAAEEGPVPSQADQASGITKLSIAWQACFLATVRGDLRKAASYWEAARQPRKVFRGMTVPQLIGQVPRELGLHALLLPERVALGLLAKEEALAELRSDVLPYLEKWDGLALGRGRVEAPAPPPAASGSRIGAAAAATAAEAAGAAQQGGEDAPRRTLPRCASTHIFRAIAEASAYRLEDGGADDQLELARWWYEEAIRHAEAVGAPLFAGLAAMAQARFHLELLHTHQHAAAAAGGQRGEETSSGPAQTSGSSKGSQAEAAEGALWRAREMFAQFGADVDPKAQAEAFRAELLAASPGTSSGLARG